MRIVKIDKIANLVLFYTESESAAVVLYSQLRGMGTDPVVWLGESFPKSAGICPDGKKEGFRVGVSEQELMGFYDPLKLEEDSRKDICDLLSTRTWDLHQPPTACDEEPEEDEGVAPEPPTIEEVMALRDKLDKYLRSSVVLAAPRHLVQGAYEALDSLHAGMYRQRAALEEIGKLGADFIREEMLRPSVISAAFPAVPMPNPQVFLPEAFRSKASESLMEKLEKEKK